MLSAQALTIDYALEGGRSLRALDRIDLTIEPGSSTALLGPNGSGKSTLLFALAGLIAPSQGRVILNQQPLSTLAPRTRATHFSCLIQGETVSFDFTAFEVVALGGRHDLAPEDIERAARSALSRLALDNLSERPWSTLSGGQKQRVQIARALVPGAPYLFFDEPFNHLDLFTRALLLDVIDEERHRGTAVLFSTHDLEAAARADDAVVLHESRLFAAGTTSEVLTAGLVADVFQVHVAPLATANGETFLRLVSPLPQKTLCASF